MNKAKPAAALLLAAALLALLSGAACASVQGGVLDFLFGNNEPSLEQKEMVQVVGLAHVSDGVTITATDAVFDGRELSVGLLFHARRNVLTVIDSITINGTAAYRISDNFASMWLARNPFASGEGDYARGLTATIDHEYFPESERTALQPLYQALSDNGRAEVSIDLSLLIPRQSLQTVNLYGGDTAAMWKAIDAICAAGDTPISSEEPFEVVAASAFLGDEFRDNLPSQYPLDDTDSLVRYSNMTVLDSFTLDFQLDAGGDAAGPE